MKLFNTNKCNICNKKLKALPIKLIIKIFTKNLRIGYAKCGDCNYAQTLNIPTADLLKEYYKNNSQLRKKK